MTDPKFFSDKRDMDVMVRAIASAREMLSKGRRQGDMWNIDILPGCLLNFFREPIKGLTSFVQNFAGTYYHPCGTCTMGDTHTNEFAVVNENLQLKGVRNLRIADASIIPHIPNVPIAKLCMVIGIAAADRIIASF